jgi:hypothetical protein
MSALDHWTPRVDRALDIVLIKYPARTGLGVVIGLCLHLVVDFFQPALRTVPYIDATGLAWWQWLAPGLLIMHLPTIATLFKQKSIGNDEIDQALELIARGNFSPAEKRQQYRLLISRIIERRPLTSDTSAVIRTE